MGFFLYLLCSWAAIAQSWYFSLFKRIRGTTGESSSNQILSVSLKTLGNSFVPILSLNRASDAKINFSFSSLSWPCAMFISWPHPYKCNTCNCIVAVYSKSIILFSKIKLQCLWYHYGLVQVTHHHSGESQQASPRTMVLHYYCWKLLYCFKQVTSCCLYHIIRCISLSLLYNSLFVEPMKAFSQSFRFVCNHLF